MGIYGGRPKLALVGSHRLMTAFAEFIVIAQIESTDRAAANRATAQGRHLRGREHCRNGRVRG